MRRATLIAGAAFLLSPLLTASAQRVFPRTSRRSEHRRRQLQQQEGDDVTLAKDESHNRTLALHGNGTGSVGVSAFTIECVGAGLRVWVGGPRAEHTR